MQSITPACTHAGLGSSHFARRYSGNRVFFLFLRLLRCFSSPGSLPYVMDWRMDTWSLSRWVSPFGYLRINGYLLLPAAFRSLSRPSSALSAKASTLRSFLFDLPVLLAFKTGGSLAVSFHRVYNVMSSYCFDSLSLKDNSSDVSFSYLKTFNVFGLFFVYAVFKVHVRSAHMQIAQPSAGAWPTRDLLRRHLAGCSPRNVFFILLKIFD